MKRFKLTELQATAILDLQLRRLAALERKKIETEHREMTAIIRDLETLLKSPKKMRGVVADELLNVKEQYGDRRRTQIVNLSKSKDGKAAKTLTARDLLPEQQVWVGVTEDGLVSRTHDDKQPKHSGNDALALAGEGFDDRYSLLRVEIRAGRGGGCTYHPAGGDVNARHDVL